MKKLWGGRFAGDTDKLVEQFTQSVSFDQRLALYDIEGSRAHAKMLVRQGIISSDDGEAILKGLMDIELEIREGRFSFDEEFEDVHMNIEARLTALIGPVGGKLHTARSRNDQVATDLRLYLREEIDEMQLQISRVQSSLVELAEKNQEVVLPGYTHLQRAQPVMLAHHLAAYLEMLERDYARLGECRMRVNILPLGSGALAGSNFDLDREFVAAELGFDGVSQNSMDAVSDRDFVLEFISAAVLIMLHLSRLAEELILWSGEEFDFIDLPDAFCTGSSIMPQKKNPDVAELVRGKSGRVLGAFVSLATILKGLPLTYNRDLQEDKEPLFDVVDTVGACLQIMAAMLPQIRVKHERMRAAATAGFLAATDLADALAKQGLPFRQGHEMIGGLVAFCEARGKELKDLTAEDVAEYGIDKPYAEVVCRELSKASQPEAAAAARSHIGGTAPARVQEVLDIYKEKLAQRLGWEAD